MVETPYPPGVVRSGGLVRPADAPRERPLPRVGRGNVVSVALASTKGAPMMRLEAVQVDRNGIVCDRYRESRGHWSGRGPAAVTLLATEDVTEAAARLGLVLDPISLRRNIVVEGVRLDALRGRRFRVGEVVLRGGDRCRPCRYLEKLLAVPGLQEALRGRSGLRASVVRPGRIRVGDVVEALDDVLEGS